MLNPLCFFENYYLMDIKTSDKFCTSHAGEIMQVYSKVCCLFFVALLCCANHLYSQTFTSINPNHGGPGTLVTITGTDLSNVTAINFGLIQVPATPNVHGTSMTAQLPDPAVQFETPGVVSITAIDSSHVSHPTGLQFAIKGNWSVVVANFSNAATFQVMEGQSLPTSAMPTTDLTPPTFNTCFGVAIHPRGRTAYVANSAGNTVSAIDIATNAVKGVIAVGHRPNFITTNTSGTRAYVTNNFDGTISVLDISGIHEQAPVVVGSPILSDSGTPPAQGFLPIGIAMSFDNSTLYVINTGSFHLVSFSLSNPLSNPDIPTIAAIADIPGTFSVDAYSFIAVTPDNTKVYISDNGLSSTDQAVYAYSLPLQNGQTPNATLTTIKPVTFGVGDY